MIEFEKKITTDLINIDIRDRAGWTEDKNAFAKQATTFRNRLGNSRNT